MCERASSFNKEGLKKIIRQIHDQHDKQTILIFTGKEKRKDLENQCREYMKKYDHHYYEFHMFVSANMASAA
jgi:dihydroorotate dehydrogenase